MKETVEIIALITLIVFIIVDCICFVKITFFEDK